MLTLRGYNKTEGGTNRVISAKRNDDLEETITLEEAKQYLKVDFTETANDAVITGLISAARAWAEDRTGLSLVPAEVTAILQNDISGMALPFTRYDMVIEDLVVKDKDGNVIEVENYTLKGNEIFQYSHSEIHLTYSTGYDEDTLPPNLRTGIKEYMKYLYNPVRDKQAEGIARQLTAPFIVKSWIV